MSMFGAKKPTLVEVELSMMSREALEALDGDMRVLVDMMAEIIERQEKILEAVKGEILVKVAREADIHPDGVQFATETLAIEEEPGSDEAKERIAPPEAMVFRNMEDTNGEGRTRTSPFTRAPRHVQVEWLFQVMADGEWYSAIGIAREYATDERHFRYMKGALGGRLREMNEEGFVERRDSHVRGSMFEYRLSGKPLPEDHNG